MAYKPVQEVEEEYDSHDENTDSSASQPLMFIDIAMRPDQEPVRIAIYEDSDPLRLAKKFIKQQGIESAQHYDELVHMMQQAKEKVLAER